MRLHSVFALASLLLLVRAVHAQGATVVTIDIQLSDQLSIISVSSVPDDVNRVKRLHLIDESRRKRQTDGILYAVNPSDIIDMMARYHVVQIQLDETKNHS